ncbi:MAG: hypothetical protein WC139_07215 [Candidatus Kapaibacterium sp.]
MEENKLHSIVKPETGDVIIRKTASGGFRVIHLTSAGLTTRISRSLKGALILAETWLDNRELTMVEIEKLYATYDHLLQEVGS